MIKEINFLSFKHLAECPPPKKIIIIGIMLWLWPFLTCSLLTGRIWSSDYHVPTLHTGIWPSMPDYHVVFCLLGYDPVGLHCHFLPIKYSKKGVGLWGSSHKGMGLWGSSHKGAGLWGSSHYCAVVHCCQTVNVLKHGKKTFLPPQVWLHAKQTMYVFLWFLFLLGGTAGSENEKVHAELIKLQEWRFFNLNKFKVDCMQKCSAPKVYTVCPAPLLCYPVDNSSRTHTKCTWIGLRLPPVMCTVWES